MRDSRPFSLRNSERSVGVFFITLLLLGAATCSCAAPPSPVGPDPSPPQTTQPDRPDARTRLSQALRALPRPEPVLGALDSGQRNDLDRILAALSSGEVAQLRRSESPMARARPLLHLMAGGRSPDALLVLATSSKGSEELLQIGEPVDLERVLAATNEVVRRAALEWLDGARQALDAQDVDVEFCEAVDRVAATLDAKHVRHASRELWLELEPSAAARLNLAQALLWLGETDAAEAAYREAKAEAPDDSELGPFLEILAERIERARAVETQAPDLSGRIARARTYLEFGEPSAAKRLLEADRAQASKHLALAVTLLQATYPDLPCAGVVAGLGHPTLCAFVQQRELFSSQAFADLERAFQAGAGRTPESLQDYLGLTMVLPWKAESALSGRADVAARAGALAEAAGALGKEGSEFAAISLFAGALEASARAAASAATGHSSSIAEPRASELRDAALAMGKASTSSRHDRAAVLAVAAVLSQQLDIRELLDWAAGEDPLLSLTEAALGVWASATWGDDKRYEKAQGRALAVISRVAPESMARSALVLLLAESEFAIRPTENNLKALALVTRKLATPEVPAELSLRAALDRSACLEKMGDKQGASDALRAVIEGLSKRELGRVPWLEALGRARLALLSDSNPGERLRAFEAAFPSEALSSGLTAWRSEWLAKLRSQRQTRARKAENERRMGPVQARLAARDLLTLGALELSLDYYPELGVVPLVRAEPQLIFVPFP